MPRKRNDIYKTIANEQKMLDIFGKYNDPVERAKNFRDEGIEIDEAKRFIHNPVVLKDGGYTLEEFHRSKEMKFYIKDAGFSLEDLLNLEHVRRYNVLEAGFGPHDYDGLHELMQKRFIQKCKLNKYEKEFYIRCGFDDKKLGEMGLIERPLTVREQIEILENKGFKTDNLIAKMKQDGKKAHELMDSFTVKQLKDGGYELADFDKDKFGVNDMKTAFTLEELKNKGYSATQMKEGGVTLQEAKGLGYPLRGLSKAWRPSEMLQAGLEKEKIQLSRKKLTDINTFVKSGYIDSDVFSSILRSLHKKGQFRSEFEPAVRATYDFIGCLDNHGECVAMGLENKAIDDAFGFFDKLSFTQHELTKVARGGSGIIYTLSESKQLGVRNVKVTNIFKENNLSLETKPDLHDFLFYEAMVGMKFINQMVPYYPCFLETYGLYYKDKQELPNGTSLTQMKKYSSDFSIQNLYDVITKQPVCGIFMQFLKQADNEPKTLGKLLDFLNKNIEPEFLRRSAEYKLYYCSIPSILFQIYAVLNALQGQYVHGDIDYHSENIMLYRHDVVMKYHIKKDEVIEVYCPFIVKFIDYGRSFFDLKEPTDPKISSNAAIAKINKNTNNFQSVIAKINNLKDGIFYHSILGTNGFIVNKYNKNIDILNIFRSNKYYGPNCNPKYKKEYTFDKIYKSHPSNLSKQDKAAYTELFQTITAETSNTIDIIFDVLKANASTFNDLFLKQIPDFQKDQIIMEIWLDRSQPMTIQTKNLEKVLTNSNESMHTYNYDTRTPTPYSSLEPSNEKSDEKSDEFAQEKSQKEPIKSKSRVSRKVPQSQDEKITGKPTGNPTVKSKDKSKDKSNSKTRKKPSPVKEEPVVQPVIKPEVNKKPVVKKETKQQIAKRMLDEMLKPQNVLNTTRQTENKKTNQKPRQTRRKP